MVGSVAWVVCLSVQIVVSSLWMIVSQVQMVVVAIVDDSITGADVCCCHCRCLLLPAQVVIPESIMAGSYRKSRDHVSYVTRSRVNRHVLSYQKVRARQCHLQQPEAPPQPSPRGGSLYLLCLRVFEWLLPLGEGWDGAPMLVGTHPRQLCRSCDYIAQGCGHGPLPWVAAPLI